MTYSRATILSLLTFSVALAAHAQGGAGPAAPQTGALPPLDPQNVRDQDDMTWDDYKAIPGIDWADVERKPTQRTIRIALVAGDFPDHPFVITMPKKSDPFGNPQIDPIKREDVSKFYANFWNGRSEAHHRHTVNEYWMEQSHGTIGVEFVPFGPYKLPNKSWQYGLSGFGANNSAPPGSPVAGNQTGDLDRLWTADVGDVRSQFQLVCRVYAGYDETCIWQEFGEMKFNTRDDITPEFANPDPTMPKWAPTRYTPWTSWKAASYLWSNSSIIQGECSGSIVHEVSHAAFAIGDNNNNPYVTPYRRVGAGPWDIMDRGSFNGPGGPHNRWQIPVTQGGAMPAGVMLQNKIGFGFVTPANLVRLSRDGLGKSGVAVATVLAREVQPGATGISGIVVQLDGEAVPLPAAATGGGGGRRGGGGGAGGGAPGGPGGAPGRGGAGGAPGGAGGAGGGGGNSGAMHAGPSIEALEPIFNVSLQEAPAGGAAGGVPTQPARGGAGAPGGRGGRGGRGGGGPVAPAGMTFDRTPWVDPATDPYSQGIPNFQNFTIEVVQRIGYDSFCPDSGVLLAKNKSASSNGGPNAFTVFNWTIDAHPEDMNKLDFTRPNGEKVMRTPADYRQTNDALFHAGLNSGSQSEWKDEANKLHFYIIDMKKDAQGVMSYVIGIRSLEGAGPQQRGVQVAAKEATPAAVRAAHTPVLFTLKNTGATAQTDPALHPGDMRAYLNNDIYRLSVSVTGEGWSAQLKNALDAVPFGETHDISTYVSHTAGAAPQGRVTLTATSESDPTKTMKVERVVTQ